jgi:3-hydroxyanthranilate 3,4-dioxygenase
VKLPPLHNLRVWIDEHRDLLRPPVGNAQIWSDQEFMVTVVGGPNARKDYHVDPGEEFFYQLEGTMTLRIMGEDGPQDLAIGPGEIFLLPALVPHSPQRPPHSIGVVIERQRREGETDFFRWYCEHCHHQLHEVGFFLTDITTQLAPAFAAFYGGDPALRTCTRCHAVLEPPAPAPQP